MELNNEVIKEMMENLPETNVILIDEVIEEMMENDADEEDDN